MTSSRDNTRRARRLLRWYPPSWRERYGEEFVDHLEQEFEDRPSNLGRGINVMRKGVVARLGDIGLSNAGASSEERSRAALGTSFALVALMAVITVDFWSRAMLAWSGRRYHPIPVTATTAVLTVSVALMLLVLAIVVIVVVASVVRQFFRGRGGHLVIPSILAVVSGAYLLYAARLLPTFLSQYIHGVHGQSGMSFSRPGQAIANFAEIVWMLTQRWVAPWGQGPIQLSGIQTVFDDCVPLVMLIFGIAICLLLRRVELPRASARLVLPTVALLGTFTGGFFIAYLVWSGVSGPSDYEYFFPEAQWLGIVYLVLMGLVPLLVGCSAVLSRRAKPRSSLNHIEILSS